jgi:ubiquinone/menaquinone biosynthesis C-methylase UbiE
MEADLQRRIQRYGWDKAVVYYQEFWQAQLWPAQEWLLNAAAVKPGEKILDIACGTGMISFPLAKSAGESGSVIATDISEKMIAYAQEAAEKNNIGNISFERMDGEELHFPDDSFDLVICSLGLMYMPFPGKAIAEMFRVLKPGGRMLSLVWGERKDCGWAEIFPIVESRVSSEVCPMFFQMGTPGIMELHLKNAGFHESVVKRMNILLHYDSAEDACGAASPVDRWRWPIQVYDETKTSAQQEYIDSISVYKTGNGCDIPVDL